MRHELPNATANAQVTNRSLAAHSPEYSVPLTAAVTYMIVKEFFRNVYTAVTTRKTMTVHLFIAVPVRKRICVLILILTKNTHTLIHNAWHNQGHSLIGTPYMAIIASDGNLLLSAVEYWITFYPLHPRAEINHDEDSQVGSADFNSGLIRRGCCHFSGIWFFVTWIRELW